MNVILGSSGQVGSYIIGTLHKSGIPVKGIFRDTSKAHDFRVKGIAVDIVDYFDLDALKQSFKDADLAFLITPENMKSEDVLGDTERLLKNYREAIESSSIKKIIGLSSLGAQHESMTGNLQMSYMLEHAFSGLPITQVFIRPAYYYSNWLPYLPCIKESGILPTFFPVNLSIPMNSPIDVASFAAKVIAETPQKSAVFELQGPRSYSSNDVANAFGSVLSCNVQALQIDPVDWPKTLREAELSEDVIRNVIEMTKAVIEGKAVPEKDGVNQVELETTFEQYLTKNLN